MYVSYQKEKVCVVHWSSCLELNNEQQNSTHDVSASVILIGSAKALAVIQLPDGGPF